MNSETDKRGIRRVVQLGAPVKLEPSLAGMPESPMEQQTRQVFMLAQQEAGRILQEAHQQAQHQLQQAQAQAEALVTQSQHQAAALRQEAEQQVVHWQEEARQAGHQQGYTEGWEQARQEAAALLQAAAQMSEAALTSKHDVFQHFGPQAVALMREVVAHLLGQAFAQQQDRVLALAFTQAVEQLHWSGEFTLLAHPTVLAALKQGGVLAETATQLGHKLKLQADPLLEPDEVLLLGEEGLVELFHPGQQAQRLTATLPVVLPENVIAATD